MRNNRRSGGATMMLGPGPRGQLRPVSSSRANAFALASVLALACGSAPTPGTPEALRECAEQAPGAPAVALTPAQSRLGVSVTIAERRIQSELARQVPKTLATGKNQPIGAPGKVSYAVQRSGFSLRAEPEELSVGTTLTGDIKVCKPIGAFCLNYGSCRPEWAVRASLPLNWQDPLSVKPITAVEVTKGCVLSPVGYDATPELKRITAQQSAQAVRQVQGEARRVEARLSDAWQQLAAPLKLPDGQCLNLQIDELLAAPPKQAGGQLTTAFEIRGHVRLGCDSAELAAAETRSNTADGNSAADDGPTGVTRSAPDAGSAKLPPPKITPDPSLAPTIDLSLETPWPLSELEHALREALGRTLQLQSRAVSSPASSPSESSASPPGESSAANALYVGLEQQGCVRWQRVTPTLVDGRLRLFAADASSELPADLTALSLQLPQAAQDLRNTAQTLPQRILDETAQLGLDLTSKLQTDYTEDVLLAPDQLQIVHHVLGSAALDAQ